MIFVDARIGLKYINADPIIVAGIARQKSVTIRFNAITIIGAHHTVGDLASRIRPDPVSPVVRGKAVPEASILP